MDPHGTVLVTVINLAGNRLLGPVELPQGTALGFIRSDLLREKGFSYPPWRVWISLCGTILHEIDALIGEREVELVATFGLVQPSPEERVNCLKQLEDHPWNSWTTFPDEAFADKEIVLKVATYLQVDFLEDHMHESLRSDVDFMMKVVQKCPLCLRVGAAACRDDRNVVSAATETDATCLQYAGPGCRDDRGIVLAAISRKPATLQFAGPNCRNDTEIVTKAIKRDANCLAYASDACRDNWKVVMKAVKRAPHALQYAGDACRSDFSIVMRAVEKQPHALRHASDACKDDRRIVLAAVERRPHSLKYASRRCRGDWEILAAAIQRCPKCLQYASARVDREFLLSTMLRVAQERLRRATYYRTRKGAFQYCQHAVCVLNRIEEHLQRLQCLSSAFQYTISPRIITEVIQGASENEYRSIPLGRLRKVISNAVRKDLRYLQYTRDRMAVMQAIRTDPRAIYYLSDSSRDDPAIATTVIESNVGHFPFLGHCAEDDFQSNYRLVRHRFSV